jgi:hypothetical protein
MTQRIGFRTARREPTYRVRTSWRNRRDDPAVVAELRIIAEARRPLD